MECRFFFCFQDAYTRVLKGQIDLALAVFPNNTQGNGCTVSVESSDFIVSLIDHFHLRRQFLFLDLKAAPEIRCYKEALVKF